ncbi:MAG: hypothetical protein VKJ64_10250 [Leptolyngbyaceae bacterium]|nr:hypothetical protein [Leptolyngbyaceae bacterium]
MEYPTTQVFRCRQTVGRKIFLLGLILLCNSLALQNSFVISVSGFLAKIGPKEFLVVSLASYSFMLIVMSLQSLVIDRFSRMALIKGTAYSFAFAFVIIRLIFLTQLPNWFKYSLFCLTTEIQWLIFPLVFWIFANSIFTPSDSERIFPRIGAWGIAGNLLGIGVSTFSPAILKGLHLSSDELITVNVIVYAVILLCLESKSLKLRQLSSSKNGEKREKFRQKVHDKRDTSIVEILKETVSSGWILVQTVPALRYLMYSILMLSFCDAIIEFHFLSTSVATYPGVEKYQFVYGLYRLTLTILGFAIQAFVSTKVIQRLGLKNTFLITPLAVLVSLIGMIVIPGIGSGLGGILVFRLCWDTIGESSRKSFHGFVPDHHRGRVSLFLDGNLFCLGNIVGFVITGLVILLDSSILASGFYIYLGLATIASVIALWAIMRMRAAYDYTILNWQLQSLG